MVRLLVRHLEPSPEAVECVGGEVRFIRENTEAIIDNQFSE